METTLNKCSLDTDDFFQHEQSPCSKQQTETINSIDSCFLINAFELPVMETHKKRAMVEDGDLPVAKKINLNPTHVSTNSDVDDASDMTLATSFPHASTSSDIKTSQLQSDCINVSKSTSSNGDQLIDSFELNPKLSSEQQMLVMAALKGESFFFTGAAGTGKSYVLQEIVRAMKHIHTEDQVQVTAPTGIAALALQGTTIHAFAGIGLGNENVDVLISKICKNRSSRKRWFRTRALIIDEVSMMSADLFDKLSQIADSLKSKKPFGGIQIILCGDFFQLPPVRNDDVYDDLFCFKSNAWKNVIKKVYTLTKIFRQKDDNVFIQTLNAIRHGQITTEIHDLLLNRTKKHCNDEINPTRLYPTRSQVHTHNLKQLELLEGQTKTFVATDQSKYPNSSHLKQIQQSCPAPAILDLKCGAQVILVKNYSTCNLCNGSRGVVIDFVDEISEMNSIASKVTYPRVKFENDVTRIIRPERWSLTLDNQELASREQLPLILAWAISIHKCVHEDTLISTCDGGLRRIKDMSDFPDRSRIWRTPHASRTSKSTNTLIYTNNNPACANEIYCAGIQPMCVITTALGISLQGSAIHPVLTFNVSPNDPHVNEFQHHTQAIHWKSLNSLVIGDQVVIKCGLQSCGNTLPSIITMQSNTKDEMQISTTGQCLYIDAYYCQLLAIVCSQISHCTHDAYYVSTDKLSSCNMSVEKIIRHVLCQYRIENNYLIIERNDTNDILKQLGFLEKSINTMNAPWSILENTLDNQFLYVMTIWKLCMDTTRTSIFHTSSIFLQQLQVMLLNFGIVTTLKKTIHNHL